ncbi:MAG: glycosyltransferase [Symploca sp. SIO1C4]|uniref:Glycosyltransferase n=1 Tax=Symploca sp. SIO1C4 TaxID=2607765 RepID=A0A6B3NBA3_9CYAN|nr:glycosyltransferase [Symploca sp. SIO1C4]NET07885.1 glycosyltransferase [Symploca sp. SIO2B6]
MKILLVTPYLGSVYGGTSKVVTKLAQGLSTLGITIDLVTTDANGSNNLDIPLNTWIDEKNYRVRYFSSWHRHDLIISRSLISWLFNHVVDYKLVHTHTIFAPLISVSNWVCKFHKIPYIITPHGMLEPWALSYKAWKKKLYYTLVEKPILQKASAIQVLAAAEANSVQSLSLKPPVIVVPNGIHRQEFEILPDPEIFYQQFPATRNKILILFLGRIDPKKGLDLLAPAFAKLHKQFPNTHLVVAGPDSIGFLPIAKNYFEQAACLNSVTFTGMLTGQLKYAALAAANLYVAPSYSEGFSMSVLEGMASGLPCVITKGCNFPEAAAANAAHVVDIKSEAITNALIECLNNPQQAKAMGDRAHKLILEKYTWEQVATKMHKVYTTLVNKNRSTLTTISE